MPLAGTHTDLKRNKLQGYACVRLVVEREGEREERRGEENDA